jgi:Domain of unknown function (DUF4349)
MEPYRDDPNLTAALRALRPTPRPEFAAELDARAVSGFRRDGLFAGPLARFASRLRSTTPRRLLAPAGALALTALVVATAVVSVNESGPSGQPAEQYFSGGAPSPQAVGRSEAGVQSSAAGPKAASPSAGSGVAKSAGSVSGSLGNSGPYASQAARRDIERSAQIVLGAEPSEVRTDAGKVFNAVHDVDGIVLRSSIRDEAGAEFDLLIPSAKLGDALASFSAIAEVRSRHESTQDITAPTIGVGERLRDSRAKIEGLLRQLANADTDTERTAVEAQLRAERRHAAALRSRLSTLRRRANFSRVSLRIETGEPTATGGNEGDWGVNDALDNAGRILTVAAGVAVIALAILGPLALIALLAWLAHRTLVRRSRERALG